MSYKPLANGIRTDHPIPGLPFVDDSLLDLTDPSAIEEIGRSRGEHGMWGRQDTLLPLRPDREDWTAFTTIPDHPHLAWSVRHYADHGSTVTLVADEDAASMHNLMAAPVLTRAGGYWWDGDTWYRPEGRYDPIARETEHESVPEAQTVTVTEVLRYDQPQTPQDLTPLSSITADSAITTHVATPAWVAHHLSCWLEHHPEPADWDRAVVTIQAPELDTTRMLTVAAVAAYTSLAEDTIRAYLARGQMPAPQTRTPSIMWAKPVIAHWRETVARRNTPRVEVNDRWNTLDSLAYDLSSVFGSRLRRGRLRPEKMRHLALTVGRYTLGLSQGPERTGRFYGGFLATDCHEILSGRARYFSDSAMEYLISLIEVNEIAAMLAVEEAVRGSVENARQRVELEHAKVSVVIAEQKVRAAEAETEVLRATQAGDIAVADAAEAERGYAQAEQRARSYALHEVEEALERIDSGRERRLVEDALRTHPFMVERPELVAWIEHTLGPR